MFEQGMAIFSPREKAMSRMLSKVPCVVMLACTKHAYQRTIVSRPGISRPDYPGPSNPLSSRYNALPRPKDVDRRDYLPQPGRQPCLEEQALLDRECAQLEFDKLLRR